jgi:glutamate-ammonia-ligase adenylyltransferase
MGKLGGRELNYSSDIDLIYIHNGEQGRTFARLQEKLSAKDHCITEGISNTEFFTKLAQSITSELSTLTEEGYFYRVDLRLRPEGSTGSVASSLTACRNYYATWGETFERMALIKARPVAGSAELGREFLEAFQSFVYRKFLDFASLDEIQEIKTRIDSKLGSRRKQEAHVKLGAGGIREIEFFVQALQLIYGGQTPDLQEPNTLKALHKLLAYRFVREQEYRELREAYLFLRDLEHKLQLVFHLQTHELPDSGEELYKCARRMGFEERSVEETLNRFRKTYQQHTANVNRIFQNLVTFRRRGASGDQVNEAALVLNKNLTEGEVYPILGRHGFRDLRSVLHQIVLLRDAPSFAHSPSKMRNLLANLMPPLLGSLGSSPDPDAGLTYFEKFASALGERDSLYTLLNESPAVLSRLIRILSSSQSLAEFLCHRPEFLDSLVRQDLLQKRKSLRGFRRELEQILEKAGNREARRSALRSYQQAELFRIGMKDLVGQLRRPQVGEQLAALAEACLLAAFDIACLELEHDYGKGLSRWARDHFAILALGKLGGGDLSYNSDLDLVFFYRVDDMRNSMETQRRCVRLVELLDQILSVSQGEGSIYKIDTRLRPEGKKGELVVAMHRYQEYLQKRAEAWERLALVRQRILLGCPLMRRRLKHWIEAFVYRSDLDPTIVAELGRIRHRMELEIGKEADGERFHLKAGVGGLLDVEFATQLLQMKHGAVHQEIRGSNTTAVLRKLGAAGLITRNQFAVFQNGYEFLRLLENRLRIASPYGTVYFPRTPETFSRIYRLLNPTTGVMPNCAADFENTYLDRTREIRNHFHEIVGNLSRRGTP